MYNNILINDALNKNSGLNNFFTLFDGKTTPGSENASYATDNENDISENGKLKQSLYSQIITKKTAYSSRRSASELLLIS